MPAKPLMSLASATATAGLVLGPVAANAGGMSQVGTGGKPAVARVSNLTCGVVVPAVGVPPQIPARTTNIYKPVTITNTVDAFRNISVIKNIDNSKTIDASKNIEIDKPVVIQKTCNTTNSNTTNNNNSTSEGAAQAIATAIAQLNSTIQITNNNSSHGSGGGNITVIAAGGASVWIRDVR